MKTISIQADRFATFGNRPEPGSVARDAGFGRIPAVPAWRFVPALAQVRPSRKPARPVCSLWLAPVRESFGERLMLGLITVAAVAAIGHGFAAMLDLVQHWAAFNQGIGQMLQ